MIWFAFFLTFVVWFNLPPLATTIKEEFGLQPGQMATLAVCNVALTVPARIIIGMLLDRFGPRLTYSVLLVYAAVPCLIFATAQNFNQLVLGRLLMGIVGAGVVIGIRMVEEWFSPQEIGLAEGNLWGLGQLWFGLFRFDAGDCCRCYGNVGAVAYLTTLSLLPMWLGGGADPALAIIDRSNVIFFQILGIASLVVAFLCFFFLEEPKDSFAEFHEGEHPDLVPVGAHPSALPNEQSARIL
jgi:nitrate/nitrite transporter NarK